MFIYSIEYNSEQFPVFEICHTSKQKNPSVETGTQRQNVKKQSSTPFPSKGSCRTHTTTESISFKVECDFLAITQKNYILSRDLITSLNITGTFSTLHISHKYRNSFDILVQ